MKYSKFLPILIVTLSVPSIGHAFRDCSNLETRYEDAKARVSAARNAWLSNYDYKLSAALKGQYDSEIDR